MNIRQANCPGCGGEVRFDTRASVVTVCPSCRTVVGRAGQNIENLGKVAELAETNSPLQLDTEGRYGLSFRLTGRAQLRESSGAMWDEWYATFSDGRVAWLAEAQGRFMMTFVKSLAGPPVAFDALEVGQEVSGLPVSGRLVVAEKNRAQFVAAEGEIPFRLRPGEEYGFADLSGERGEFGTLDYSTEPPQFFFGRQVTLEQLGLKALSLAQAAKVQTAKALQVSCPQCGGALNLHAPDQTERVGCPYCGALLDARKGNLTFLEALKKQAYEPILPLGASGVFENVPQTVIAFLVRSTELEGTTYTWEEYLLYHPQTGYRWLVRSDDHWTYARAIPAGDVREQGEDAVYQGKTYERYQDSKARVEHVVGEVYWQVAVGEEVQATDYSGPPTMLSKEVTLARDGAPGQPLGEVNWSFAEYVKPEVIETQFKLEEKLDRPTEEHPALATASGGGCLGSKVGCLIFAVIVVIIVLVVIFSDSSGGGTSSGGHGSVHIGGGK